MRLTRAQFDRAVADSRLEAGSLAAGRAVLVEGRSAPEVAREAGLTRQRVHAIKARILKLHEAASVVKVTAAQYMASRPRREEVLAAFAGELRRLVARGRGVDEMRQYLLANDVKATAAEIEAMLSEKKGRSHEDGGVRKPKGRRRKDR
jgi:hypothetical protein